MGLPKGTNTILMEYSDRDSKGMNNGGYGQIHYKLASTEASAWDKAGAYMPPCSWG